MGHREEAERYLKHADDRLEWTNHLSTTHAVLALLDYLQEHDGDEPVFDPTSPQVIVLQNRIRHLEEDLKGARAALRARDTEVTTETNQGNEKE